jgi:hypothetical protein
MKILIMKQDMTVKPLNEMLLLTLVKLNCRQIRMQTDRKTKRHRNYKITCPTYGCRRVKLKLNMKNYAGKTEFS